MTANGDGDKISIVSRYMRRFNLTESGQQQNSIKTTERI